MNCKKTLAIIDSLPVLPVSSPLPGQITKHIRQCKDCRTAFTASELLDSQLSRFPLPESPPHILPHIKVQLAAAGQRDLRKGQKQSPIVRRKWSWLTWATICGGLVTGLYAQIYKMMAGDLEISLANVTIIRHSWDLTQHLSASPASLAFAAGMFICAAGMLAPLKTGKNAH